VKQPMTLDTPRKATLQKIDKKLRKEMSKNFLREEIRQTSVTIGYSLLKKYSNHAEKKEIVKGLGKGKPFQDCVNELIQTFEKGQDNKMISILIQEALLLSSREYQSLRTMLSYHFDPLEKKTCKK
jgi:CRISPR/Cas system-associated protein Cas5 (RAMP superfamily)